MKKIIISMTLFLSMIGNVNAVISLSPTQIEKNKAIELYNAPNSSDSQVAQAIIIFEKHATEDPNMLFYYGLANLQQRTTLLVLDQEKGLNFIQQAAISGNSDAKYRYGMYLMENDKIEEGLKQLKQASLKNQKDAQYQLGKMYYKGIYVMKNKNNGFELIKAAAKNEHPDAQFDLAKIYFSQNSQEIQSGGVYWLNKSVINKNFKACDDLYKIYYAGIIVAPSTEKHLKYLNCSALNKNESAMTLLASYYEKGKYVAKNKEKAIYWYKQLYDLDNEVGIYKYSLYALDNFSNDTSKIKDIISKLSDISRDNVNVALILGEIYRDGDFGVRKSSTQAIRYYEYAKDLGSEDARKEIISILNNR